MSHKSGKGTVHFPFHISKLKSWSTEDIDGWQKPQPKKKILMKAFSTRDLHSTSPSLNQQVDDEVEHKIHNRFRKSRRYMPQNIPSSVRHAVSGSPATTGAVPKSPQDAKPRPKSPFIPSRTDADLLDQTLLIIRKKLNILKNQRTEMESRIEDLSCGIEDIHHQCRHSQHQSQCKKHPNRILNRADTHRDINTLTSVDMNRKMIARPRSYSEDAASYSDMDSSDSKSKLPRSSRSSKRVTIPLLGIASATVVNDKAWTSCKTTRPPSIENSPPKFPNYSTSSLNYLPQTMSSNGHTSKHYFSAPSLPSPLLVKHSPLQSSSSYELVIPEDSKYDTLSDHYFSQDSVITGRLLDDASFDDFEVGTPAGSQSPKTQKAVIGQDSQVGMLNQKCKSYLHSKKIVRLENTV